MAKLSVEEIDPERIDVGDGISVPRSWNAVIAEEPGIPGMLRVKVVYDSKLRRVVAASVALERAGEGDEVTALLLREVRVQEALTTSGVRMITVAKNAGETLSLPEYLGNVRGSTDRTPDENIDDSVTLYRIASTINLPPLRFISKFLGVSVSTATRTMARAREAGIGVDLLTRETYNRKGVSKAATPRPFIDLDI